MVSKFDFIHASDSYMTRMHPWTIKIEAEQNTDRYCTAHLAADTSTKYRGDWIKIVVSVTIIQEIEDWFDRQIDWWDSNSFLIQPCERSYRQNPKRV